MMYNRYDTLCVCCASAGYLGTVIVHASPSPNKRGIGIQKVIMDRTTIKWWIDRCGEFEDENKHLRDTIDDMNDMVKDMIKVIAHQESELRRLERLQY